MSAIPLQRIEGKYEILEKIREGGMGAIYKVRHRLLDEIRVIKLMRPQLVEDEELRARFVREARVAIKLRHPNIAQLYDFTADEDGTALIVMEFIKGKTLEDLLKSAGPPPLGLALEIAQQSLRALGYLHGKGFVHRDISPDNLMLTEDTDGNPQIKLIDLGIAKILGGADAQLTHTGTFLGKVRYASPEQFGSEGAVTADARGDLYSFGIVLYELLTGTYPIAGRDPSSIIAAHLFRPPLPFEETDRQERVPPGLRAVALKALAKKADGRFASAQEFARELAAFRVAHDLPADEWKKLIETADGGEGSPVEPGSTQDRLDAHFDAVATPPPTTPAEAPRTLLSPVAAIAPRAPAAVAPAARTESEAPGRTQGVEAVLREARELLARSDPGGAIDVLRRAPARSRRNRDLSQLLKEAESQLAQQQEKRRLAIDATVEAVEAALAGGDLRTAEGKLYAAEAAFGDQPVFRALHGRLAAQRQEELAARVARLVESARGHAAAGELALAHAELKRALQLDPGRSDLAAEAAETEAARERQAAESVRREAVAQAVAGVESELAASGPEKAGTLLAGARAEHGEDPAFDQLGRRLEEMRRQALAEQLAALLDEARRLAAAESWKEAGKLLRRAERLAPEDAVVQQLKEEVAETSRRREEERRRAAQIDRRVAEIGSRLDAGDLEQGAALLESATTELGEVPVWEELRARLGRLREEAREARIVALLAQARQLAADQDLRAALASARQAEEIDASRGDVQDLVAELAATLERQERERRLAEDLSRTVAVLGGHLDRGELEQAGNLLDRAVTRFGAAPALRDHWQRLEQLRREALAEQLLQEARLLFEVDDLEAAGRKLRQALDLVPGYAVAQALLDRVQEIRQQTSAETRRTPREPAHQAPTLTGATLHLPSVPAGAAAMGLPAADVDKSGQRADRAPGSALASAAAAAGGTMVTASQRLARVPSDQPSPAGIPVPAGEPPARQGLAAAAPPAGAGETRVVEPPEPGRAVDAAVIGSRRSITPPIDFQLRAGPAAAKSSPPAAAELAGKRPLPVGLIAGVGLALVVLAMVVWLVGHRRGGGATSQTARLAEAPSGAPAAAAAAPVGALIVDALPWGVVVEIRDAQGKAWPVPASAYTPVVLSLPPGRYTVQLRNPAFPRPAAVVADVPAGGGAVPVRTLAEFAAGDVDQFLKGMGW